MTESVEIGLRQKCSTAASTPDRAKSVSLFKRLFSKPASHLNKGVDITNAMSYLTAIDEAVRMGIYDVPVRERRSVLNMYRTALRVQSRGLLKFIQYLEQEGAL